MLTSSTALKLIVILPISIIAALVFVRAYPRPTPPAQAQIESADHEDIKEGAKVSPTSISVESAGINIAIAPGLIREGEWTLYDDKAAWLSSSSVPGLGNVIIYAHNREGQFAHLDRAEVGDKIVLAYKSNPLIYKIEDIKKVEPGDVGAILSDKDQLTLYTCEGTFDEKRLIVIAKPI